MASGEYPIFKEFNRNVIKPAIKEINELTNFFVEIEQKRESRKIAFLKFRISKLKQLTTAESTEESLYPDVEELPAIALTLVQAGVARREALKITNQQWDAVEADIVMENYPDFAEYVDEKIALAQQATHVKNIGGFIVQAIRDNYQDPPNFNYKLRYANTKNNRRYSPRSNQRCPRKGVPCSDKLSVRTPELLEQAAQKIQSYLARERLASYNSLQEAYRDGGMVTAEINGILAEEFCQDLIAPIISAYEDEKARILTEPER